MRSPPGPLPPAPLLDKLADVSGYPLLPRQSGVRPTQRVAIRGRSTTSTVWPDAPSGRRFEAHDYALGAAFQNGGMTGSSTGGSTASGRMQERYLWAALTREHYHDFLSDRTVRQASTERQS